MSGIDFKSFLIGILITVIFIFTTGSSIGGGEKYTVSCAATCFVLNTETGVGRYVYGDNNDKRWKEINGRKAKNIQNSEFGREGLMPQGVKPDF